MNLISKSHQHRHFMSVLMAFVLTASGLAANADPSGSELMHQMTAAESSVSYSGFAAINAQGAKEATMRVWRQGRKRRLEFLSPPVRQGDVMVDNGTTVSTYHHAENVVIQTHVPDSRGVDWSRLDQNYTVRVEGRGSAAGRSAWVVALYNKKDGRLARKYWIDAATKSRLKIVRYSASGQAIENIALQSVQYGAVGDSHFQFSKPPGATVQATSGVMYSSMRGAQRAAGWMQYAHYLPPGYAFESAVVETNNVWLRYSNGLSRFSIFQQRAPGQADAPLPRVKSGAWYWRRNGSRFLLVGAPPGEITHVVDGVD